MVVLVGLTAQRHSDLSRITAWWRGLGGDGFVALPPPTRNRYTQSDGHEDAAELFAARGSAGGASFGSARPASTHPLHVAERLIGKPGIREYVLHRLLIGVADPAQPLRHYALDPRSRGWWQRAREVTDDLRLSAGARAIGLKAASAHYVLRHPDQVRPSLTDGEVNEARA
ncbi:hypothetical protein [Streptomyces cyaneofuscatus]|uniref:hypothetical protein n=1 Tax=Streptomyces cyaneofuscatus TaxID=66883 RepID=UPI003F4D2DBF